MENSSPPPPSHEFTPPPPPPMPPSPPSPPSPSPLDAFVSRSEEPAVPSLAASSFEPDFPSAPTPPAELMPQPVVQVLSPRGVEYVFLAITLFTGAIGLGAALLSLVNGQTSFSVLAFPAAVLLVAVPLFAWLFLRLKKAELADPGLRTDASKRRTTQFIQISSFLVCFFTLIGFLVTMFSKMSGDYNGSAVKIFLDVLVILIIAGGILAYYWRDEHRTN